MPAGPGRARYPRSLDDGRGCRARRGAGEGQQAVRGCIAAKAGVVPGVAVGGGGVDGPGGSVGAVGLHGVLSARQVRRPRRPLPGSIEAALRRLWRTLSASTRRSDGLAATPAAALSVPAAMVRAQGHHQRPDNAPGHRRLARALGCLMAHRGRPSSRPPRPDRPGPAERHPMRIWLGLLHRPGPARHRPGRGPAAPLPGPDPTSSTSHERERQPALPAPGHGSTSVSRQRARRRLCTAVAHSRRLVGAVVRRGGHELLGSGTGERCTVGGLRCRQGSSLQGDTSWRLGSSVRATRSGRT